MDVRVEPSLGLDLSKAFLGQEIVERAVHESDSVLELRLFVIRGGLERTPEIVEDRDQLLDEPFVGALRQTPACSRALRLRKLSNSAASRWSRSRSASRSAWRASTSALLGRLGGVGNLRFPRTSAGHCRGRAAARRLVSR